MRAFLHLSWVKIIHHVKCFGSKMQIVLIEGVPGSGKSSMAERLCSKATIAGINAKWYQEQSQDNPLRMKAENAMKSQGNFAEECLSTWASFVDQCKEQRTIHIFEGIAFQSTVRFMMEKRENGIEQYYRRFEEIVKCLNPRMVYLRPHDISSHSRNISDLRGEDWSNKVSNYLAQTQYSNFHGFNGMIGMHQFWNNYSLVCDELLIATSIPTKTIDFIFGEWERHIYEASVFLGLERISNKSNKN
jgi:adenylate kinase family enzyme